jgi:uncharacterized protein YoxC
MPNNAVVGIDTVVPSIKRINEALNHMNEGCKKLNVKLEEAYNATNLDSVGATHTAFEDVGKSMADLAENMQKVLESAVKYVEEVVAIDEVDNRLYD